LHPRAGCDFLRTQNDKGDSMSSRWQSRVFVFLSATLGLSLVAGLVVAAGLMHG